MTSENNEEKVTVFDRRAALIEAADHRQRQIRAAAFVAATAMSIAASLVKSSEAAKQTTGWLAALTWFIFVVAVVIHRKLRAKARRLDWRRVLETKLESLRRLLPTHEMIWHLEPEATEEGRSVRRLVRDLDIVPMGGAAFVSLFPFFLSTAGQDRFLKLLTRPVTEISEVLRRQKVANFWERRTVLRRKIMRVSSTIEATVDTDALKATAHIEAAPEGSWRWLIAVCAAQVLFFVSAAVAVSVGAKWIATAGLFVWLALYAVVGRRVDLFGSYSRAMLLGRSLRVLRDVAIVLQRIAHHPEAELGAFAGGKNPVLVLEDIERAAGALGVRQNPLLALLLNFVVPWDLYWTLRFDRARRRVVGSLDGWLEGLAEMEAFIAIAEWNAAHGQAWPEFLDSNSSNGMSSPQVLVEARQLAHPLLPPRRRVANDLLVTRTARNHLVTGSNMSGKSTFLRAIGLNLLLAHAGAKVTAASLRLVPLRVESSMRPADSLADGFSSFYSEVADLVEIVKHAQSDEAVFYLIDEIFRGTNNRERRIGAEAVIRALAKTSAMGFITTHDLDLAALEGVVPGLENHHFRDDVAGGVMTFSYEYRSGPCPSTNALSVMRTAGLPV